MERGQVAPLRADKAGCALAFRLSHPWDDINCGNLDLDSHNGQGPEEWILSAEEFQNVCLQTHGTLVLVCFLHTSPSPTRLEPQEDKGMSPAPLLHQRRNTGCPGMPTLERAGSCSNSLVAPCLGHSATEICSSYLRVLCDCFNSPLSFLLMVMGTHLARTCIRACFHFPC